MCRLQSHFSCSLVTLVISALYRKSYSQQRHRLGKSVLKTRPLVPSPPRGGHWDPEHHPLAFATNERTARCSVAVCLHDNTVPKDGISAASGLPEAGGSESASKTPATTDVTFGALLVDALASTVAATREAAHLPHSARVSVSRRRSEAQAVRSRAPTRRKPVRNPGAIRLARGPHEDALDRLLARPVRSGRDRHERRLHRGASAAGRSAGPS